MRAQEDELNRYLESLLAGGALDSTGEFAIDPARANLLSGSFLYTRPAAYLLKLVQAAVATRPQKVMVEIGRDAIEVRYTPTRDWPTINEVEQAIRSPFGSHPSIHLKNLSLGLQAAAAQSARWVVWSSSNTTEGWGIMLQGGECRRIKLPPSRVARCLFRLKYATLQQPFWRRIFGASSVAAEATHLLADRCRFATCPIYLDERLLNAPSIPRLSSGKSREFVSGRAYFGHVVERAILSKQSLGDLLVAPHPIQRGAHFYDLGSEPQNLLTGSRNSVFIQQWRSFSGDPALFPAEKALTLRDKLSPKMRGYPNSVTLECDSQDEEGGTRLWVEDLQDWTRPTFKLPYGGQERPFAVHAYLVAPGLVAEANSQLQVVQFGVTVESHPIELAMPGMLALVADNALETDLSGLKLLENQRLSDLVGWLRKESEEMQKDLEVLEIPYESVHGPLQSF